MGTDVGEKKGKEEAGPSFCEAPRGRSKSRSVGKNKTVRDDMQRRRRKHGAKMKAGNLKVAAT
jgi:hypothetical protein